MRIIVVGLRGIPNIAGGVETHVEHLCPLLVEMGCSIEVLGRSNALDKRAPTSWRGVQTKRLWAPRRPGLEAFVHTFLGVLYAAIKRPDLLHIHAIGPMTMTPLARLLGLRVIVTHHGADYEREKWDKFSRTVLRTGERLGVKYAHGCIVISEVIQQSVRRKYGQDTWLIHNGVEMPMSRATKGVLADLGLDEQRYVLHVSRLVPEKRQIDLIDAFELANLAGWKLALVGQIQAHERYSQQVTERARSSSNVVLAGYRSGVELQELYTHAGMFVLPSSHEGLPIALLEALSYGLPALASDIPANREIGLTASQYFPLGDTDALASKLQKHAAEPHDEIDRSRTREWVANRYNWRDIAHATFEVYKKAQRAASPARPLSRS